MQKNTCIVYLILSISIPFLIGSITIFSFLDQMDKNVNSAIIYEIFWLFLFSLFTLYFSFSLYFILIYLKLNRIISYLVPLIVGISLYLMCFISIQLELKKSIDEELYFMNRPNSFIRDISYLGNDEHDNYFVEYTYIFGIKVCHIVKEENGKTLFGFKFNLHEFKKIKI